MKNASIVAALALAISFLSGNDAFAVRPATLAVRARPISATNSALKHVTGRRLAVLRMADEESSTMTAVEEEAPEEPAVNAEFGSAGFFAPSANVRFGTSRDQDGKSNVWAIEPKMKVQESGEGGNNNALIAGSLLAFGAVVVVTTILQLPAPDSY